MKFLVLNAGSSSLKFAVFNGELKVLLRKSVCEVFRLLRKLFSDPMFTLDENVELGRAFGSCVWFH